MATPSKYTLCEMPKGMEACITNYGATIVGLTTPDRSGHFADVVLGFDSIRGYTSRAYLRESPYFGAVIGRYANRINNGRFALNGDMISLTSTIGLAICTAVLGGSTRSCGRGSQAGTQVFNSRMKANTEKRVTQAIFASRSNTL